MNLKRTATIVVVGGAVAAWLSAAMTPNERQSAIVNVRTPPAEIDAAGLASEVARLRERLRPQAAPTPVARNPFEFRATNPRPTRVAVQPPALREGVATTVIVPEPPLKLVGVAEDTGPDGPIRTAIISGGGGQLFLVKLGENVTARYEVVAISSDVVELKDLDNGSLRRLSLQ